jgi:hypothetical protein
MPILGSRGRTLQAACLFMTATEFGIVKKKNGILEEEGIGKLDWSRQLTGYVSGLRNW